MGLALQQFILKAPGKGGVNEKVDPTSVRDDQSVPPDANTLALKNCHTDRLGRIVKRKGYTVYSDLDSYFDDVAGIYQYRQFDNDEFEIAAGSKSGTVKIINFSNPGTPVDITGALTFTADKSFDFATVADILIMTTEGSDAPIKYTGGATAVALGGSPPSGKYCEEFFNYAFLANTSANPERVYWSGVFSPESWTATDFKRMEAPVTGIIRKDSYLLIFTRSSITVTQYTGDSLNPFNFDRLDTNIGCISNRSLVNIEGVVYWMAADGHIYRMSGLSPERVTEAIPLTISNLVHGTLTKAVGIDHKQLRQYWCAVTKEDTQNDFVIVIDYLNNEVFFYDNIHINSAANIADSSGQIQTFFGDREGQIYITNNGNIDYIGGVASDIDFYRYTKPFDMGNLSLDKRLRKIGVSTNAQGDYLSNIDISTNYGEESEIVDVTHNSGDYLWNGTTWNGAVWGKKDRIFQFDDLCSTGKTFQLKFSNSGQDEPVELSDLVVTFQTYQRQVC